MLMEREGVRTDAGGSDGMNGHGEQGREDGKRECPKTAFTSKGIRDHLFCLELNMNDLGTRIQVTQDSTSQCPSLMKFL